MRRDESENWRLETQSSGRKRERPDADQGREGLTLETTGLPILNQANVDDLEAEKKRFEKRQSTETRIQTVKHHPPAASALPASTAKLLNSEAIRILSRPLFPPLEPKDLARQELRMRRGLGDVWKRHNQWELGCSVGGGQVFEDSSKRKRRTLNGAQGWEEEDGCAAPNPGVEKESAVGVSYLVVLGLR